MYLLCGLFLWISIEIKIFFWGKEEKAQAWRTVGKIVANTCEELAKRHLDIK